MQPAVQTWVSTPLASVASAAYAGVALSKDWLETCIKQVGQWVAGIKPQPLPTAQKQGRREALLKLEPLPLG